MSDDSLWKYREAKKRADALEIEAAEKDETIADLERALGRATARAEKEIERLEERIRELAGG